MRATSSALLYCQTSAGIHDPCPFSLKRPVMWAWNDQSRGRPTTPMACRYRCAVAGSPARSCSVTTVSSAPDAGTPAAQTSSDSRRYICLPCQNIPTPSVAFCDRCTVTRVGVMDTIKEAAREFLTAKRVAVTGVSREAKGHGSNVVYQRLRQRGYQVFAVNPNAETVEGDTSYPDLRSIP